MPRTQGFVVENSFVNGLVTEATPLRFPENGCTETYNCIFDETGRVKRRFGFDEEPNSSPATLTITSSAFNNYLWENVAGSDEKTFLVVQCGNTLHFYEVIDSVNLSANKHGDTVLLTDFDVSGATNINEQECQFSSGNGVLFVSHPQCETFYVEYDAAGDNITATAITVKIRDFELLEDGTTSVDERPTNTVANMDPDHKYNLFNAGWYYDSNSALTAWDTAFTTMPSNADVWWFYKDSSDAFQTSLVAKRYRGNTEAPRGHYILDYYDQDRGTISGIASMTHNGTDMGTVRARTTAFFAGRLWYADIRYPGQTTKVLFSQIATSPDKYGKCYQQNDPTSESLFDLLPSDGGVININDCGSIIKLWAMDNALLVFTRQGIWSIEGSTGLGFLATDFVVRKLSSVHALTHTSFVDLDGTPCWWNETGIYTLSTSEDTPVASGGKLSIKQGSIQAVSMSDEKIKSFISSIPTVSKKNLRGIYERTSGFIIWLYRLATTDDTTDQWIFDNALVLNTRTGAFFPWTLDLRDEVQIKGITVVKTFGSSVQVASVTSASGVNTVQSGSGANNVIAYISSTEVIPPKFKYIITLDDADLTFADNSDTSYVDWDSIITDGVSYDSYFITGFMVHGDAMRHFQANYLSVYLDYMEDSSCLLQGIWDFAADESTNKFSVAQQLFNSNRGAEWHQNSRRLKLRGKGRSLQLYFYSETGKPFSITGWSKWETANQGV